MPDIRDFDLFLNPEDVEDGDILQIDDAGKVEESTFNKGKADEEAEPRLVLIMGFKLPNGKVKKMTVNRTNRKAIGAVYGNQTEEWVGRQVTAYKIMQNVFGETKEVIHLKPIKE